jgi:hypothetical protein
MYVFHLILVGCKHQEIFSPISEQERSSAAKALIACVHFFFYKSVVLSPPYLYFHLAPPLI